jgi:hypothetical protein
MSGPSQASPSMEEILNGPAAKYPPNVIPQLDNPPNWNELGYGIVCLCLLLSIMAMTLRLVARWRMLHIADCETYD